MTFNRHEQKMTKKEAIIKEQSCVCGSEVSLDEVVDKPVDSEPF
jgi:hypothetical protein